MNLKQLIQHLQQSEVLKTPRIIKAFEVVDRKDFVLPEYERYAYEDHPLPIAGGQTISQPTTVAFMLELLQPQKGDKILDVGSGSGWTTALLAYIVGESGKVFGVERISELVKFGQENLAKYSFKNAEILEAGDKLGLPDKAPFNKILVSAAAKDIPQELINQLKVGGAMVIPVQSSIFHIIKISENKTKTERYEGFSFVPLIN